MIWQDTERSVYLIWMVTRHHLTKEIWMWLATLHGLWVQRKLIPKSKIARILFSSSLVTTMQPELKRWSLHEISWRECVAYLKVKCWLSCSHSVFRNFVRANLNRKWSFTEITRATTLMLKWATCNPMKCSTTLRLCFTLQEALGLFITEDDVWSHPDNYI